MTDDQPVAWWARGLLPGLLAVLIGVTGFLAVLDGVRENEDLAHLDDPVLHWLVAARGPVLTVTMRAISLVTGPTVLPFLVLAGALAWGLRRREWWRPTLLAAAMVGSTVLGLALKGLVDRPRPPVVTMDVPGLETTASFPSGHTLGTATLLLVTGYLVVRRRPTRARVVGWAVATVLGTAAVASSRLYLGYHFLTDVVAATALAVAVLGVVMLVDARHLAGLVAGASDDP
ncbi:MAG: phosphatase PAP2 family protein [Actinobacteria bacterium]|nr:phosphatase PAP2 family protein [Actinomycetota bacterium]MCG2801453.1 phosphatase PAP2 family protein [Cellulomonas sp.]